MTSTFPKEGYKANELLSFSVIECYKCGIPFMVPSSYKENLQKRQDKFYCPNGHQQAYVKSTETILREKLKASEDEHQRQLRVIENKLLDTISDKNKLERAKRKVDKDLKRLANGVCSCCNRSFVNLQRHMRMMHPEVVK